MKIAGIHPLREALTEGKSIEKVFVNRDMTGAAWQSLAAELRRQGIPIKYVPKIKLDKMYKGVHQGVVALVAPVDFIPMEALIARALEQTPHPAFLLLDGITDTRNLGALIRSAAAFAFNGIILPASGSATITEETVKTSAGAVFKIPMARTRHLLDAIYYLQAEGIQVVAATEKTDQSIHRYRFPSSVALVLGDEHTGIQPALLKHADAKLRIPISPQMDSLNVSVAGGIFMYEIARQLQKII